MSHFLPDYQPILDRQLSLPVDGMQLQPQHKILVSDHAYICDVNALCQCIFEVLSADELTDFYFSEQALNIEQQPDQITVFTDRSNRVSAENVVLASGPWQSLLDNTSVNTKQVAAILIDQPLPQRPCLLALPEQDAFLVSDIERGKWLLSFRSEQWSVDPRAALSLTEQDRKTIDEILQQYLPSWRDCQITPLVFCDSYAQPGASKPVIEQRGNVFAVTALSGSGYRLAAGIAEYVNRLFKAPL